ncbi:MAG: TIGR03767 family metallophosphoesterase [Actinobacteria bacterium]|nr:TIGR03767 family metallophosphoesterase [Actinomycetota bacterium]
MTSPRKRPRRPLTRREFIARAATLSAAAWAVPLTGRAGREAWAQTRGMVFDPSGTTLERTITTVGGDGPYFPLTFGPGWPIEVRTELAEARSGREDRRVALAAFLHLTDYQLVDCQSPARVEFFDRTADQPTDFNPVSAAQRPQEAFVPHVVEALIRRAGDVVRGPVTGRQVSFAIATGDNLDNIQTNELRWYMTLHDGGEFTPNSGSADVVESVQTFAEPEFYDPHYYHPEPIDDPRGDVYKDVYGFPDFPGAIDAIRNPIQAVGLPMPWYTAYGNHDALVQGNVEPNPLFESIAIGPLKVLAPGGAPGDFWRGLQNQDPGVVTHALASGVVRPVAADSERAFIDARAYIRAHLDSPATPGPVGHGFTEDNLDAGTLYYIFEVVPGIRGITLDTTSPATSEGSITPEQMAWLEARLVEVHSRYYDAGGAVATTGNDDQLVVIFSHHRPASMPLPSFDASQPLAGGAALVELLQRFPNVVLWVNGHSHFNRIVVHPHDDPVRGFWDITTSAQIDPPQQARILEVTDNRDGTLSIFTTIIDHAGPPQTAVGPYDLLGLAAIGRELSYNDYQGSAAGAIGESTDRNTELLVVAPFALPAPDGGSGGDSGGGAPAPPPAPPLPTTGAGLGAAAFGAAVAGAFALRDRGRERG